MWVYIYPPYLYISENVERKKKGLFFILPPKKVVSVISVISVVLCERLVSHGISSTYYTYIIIIHIIIIILERKKKVEKNVWRLRDLVKYRECLVK